MTLLVRDEEDILEANIEYHLSQGVDYIIATDNKSVDSTKEILKKYESLGVLFYIFEGSDDYSQNKWVTAMARMAYERLNADWLINCDADEFWWPIDYPNLKTAFKNIPKDCNIVLARRHNFLYLDSKHSGHFYQNMIFRDAVSTNSIGRPLSPKVAHIGSDSVLVEQGNHNVHGIGSHVPCNNFIEILHFPVRTEHQIINKIIKGGRAYERNSDFSDVVGKTWRDLYNSYKSTGNLSDYLSRIVYNDKRLSEELQNGSIILDTRLKDFFDKYAGNI